MFEIMKEQCTVSEISSAQMSCLILLTLLLRLITKEINCRPVRELIMSFSEQLINTM